MVSRVCRESAAVGFEHPTAVAVQLPNLRKNLLCSASVEQLKTWHINNLNFSTGIKVVILGQMFVASFNGVFAIIQIVAQQSWY